MLAQGIFFPFFCSLCAQWEIMKGALNKLCSSNYLTLVFASKGCCARRVSANFLVIFHKNMGGEKENVCVDLIREKNITLIFD